MLTISDVQAFLKLLFPGVIRSHDVGVGSTWRQRSHGRDLLGYVLRGSAMRLGRGVRPYLSKRRDRSMRSMTKGPGMRPVVLQMGVTLDGFVHGAKGYEDWGLPPEDDEVVACGVILAHGGATFVDALIRDGLIDEYRLVIHPVAIGHGTGLFGALREPLRLDLIEARRFPSGTAIHVYRPREGNR